MPHELHSVTDSQHGHTQLEKLRIRLRRFVAIDAGGPTREDDSFWGKLSDFFYAGVKGDDLRVNLALADAPSDDLGILRSEIEDQETAVNGR